MIFCFGRCEFDPSARQLLIDGTQTVIGGRAFDLLQALIERRDRVVSKDELYEIVWPGLAVEPNNLQVQVWTLRKLFGAAVIATVPRRGYRFMAPVQELPELSLAQPRPLATGREVQLEDPALQAVSAGLSRHRLVTLICQDGACSRHVALAATQALASRTAAGAWQTQAEVLTGRRRADLPCSPAEQAALQAASARLQAFLHRLSSHPALSITAPLRVGHTAYAKPALPAVLVVLGCGCAEGSAEAVRQVLDMAPRLHVLATSRQPLGLAEETVLHLPLAEIPVETAARATGGHAALRWLPRAVGVNGSTR